MSKEEGIMLNKKALKLRAGRLLPEWDSNHMIVKYNSTPLFSQTFSRA